MSRITVALIGSWLGLCVLYNGASMAKATERAPLAGIQLASNDTKNARKDDAAQTETKKSPEKSFKEPARQVPVEPVDEPIKEDSGKEPEKPSGDEAEKKAADKPSGKVEKKPVKKAPEPTSEPSAAKAKEEKPVKGVKKPVKEHASAKEPDMTVPGLPVRKPRKPVYRKKKDTKKVGTKPAPPSSARNKKLCKALQKCRNAFIKCKGKIKHPDQSEPWIIAKEVCGGYYKTCVEKDFQPGEWFMTRWFYFQELNCGE